MFSGNAYHFSDVVHVEHLLGVLNLRHFKNSLQWLTRLACLDLLIVNFLVYLKPVLLIEAFQGKDGIADRVKLVGIVRFV